MNGQNTQAISQNPDVRFLGKMLGDVIRAYGGEQLFRGLGSLFGETR
jgi:phosphoenolpyruvate carboxylase